MDKSLKPKTFSESDFADESSASSSSSLGHNLRPEKIVEVKKEPASSRKTQKADREKIRRDNLNKQFLELGNALDPNRPKSDKASILTDTIQLLKDLMNKVEKLKTEYATLSQESRELIQEKSELREEKSSLKSDIEILNAQYQHRVRTMVPLIPHYSYPIPAVAITQSPISIPPCSRNNSTFMPYSASASHLSEPASIQHPSLCPGASNSSKSLDLNLMRNSNHSGNKNDFVGLELELKIHVSSSDQQDVPEKDKTGSSSTT